MVNGKFAFLFPGQGSQYIGMGRWIFDNVSDSKNYFEKANMELGFSLSDYMFNGPEDQLKQTWITQPALFLSSVVAYEWLRSQSIAPAIVAGHSLGEYSALYAAGVFSFETGIRLVYERGRAMQEAANLNPGTMAAILGFSFDKVEDVCADSSTTEEVCVAANLNSESQVVISGNVNAVKKASELALQRGALKVVPLSVSGAFHSPLMHSAVHKMKSIIQQAQFFDAKIPTVTNIDAEITTSADQFREKLIKQIDHSVRWHQTNLKLIEFGIDSGVEVGAGKVLSTLLKKVDKKKNVFNTDDFESIKGLSASSQIVGK